MVQNRWNVISTKTIGKKDCFKNALHIQSQPKISVDQNFSISRHNKNLVKRIMSKTFIFDNDNTGKLLKNW